MSSYSSTPDTGPVNGIVPLPPSNKITEVPVSEIAIAPPHDNLPGGSMFSVKPDVSEQTTVRIVLIGHIYHNGESTNQKVGAYTDVTVSP